MDLIFNLVENWSYEKECLDLFAKHYETGEIIPSELIQKIKNAANFQQGYQTVRQISFGLLDMAYHGTDPSATICSIGLMKFLPNRESEMFSPAFGYHSYLRSTLYMSDFSNFEFPNICAFLTKS